MASSPGFSRVISMKGRVALITGGFGVLGLAVARAFARAGAHLALTDRASASDEIRLELAGQHCLRGGVDLSDPSTARAVVDEVIARFGALHVLINVAGGFLWETVQDGSIESWDRMYSMNLRTTVVSCMAALAHVRAQGAHGRIINIGAFAALKAEKGMGAYTASKAGVAKLTESLAEELKDTGVTVNAVLPSIIDTPANRTAMPDADPALWVKPEALAEIILLLASDAAAVITGAQLPVRGRV